MGCDLVGIEGEGNLVFIPRAWLSALTAATNVLGFMKAGLFCVSKQLQFGPSLRLRQGALFPAPSGSQGRALDLALVRSECPSIGQGHHQKLTPRRRFCPLGIVARLITSVTVGPILSDGANADGDALAPRTAKALRRGAKRTAVRLSGSDLI